MLEGLGLNFEIKPIDLKEIINPTLGPAEIVESLAVQKGTAFGDLPDDETCLISADTLVFLKNEILGKPKDEDDAASMLSKLSGVNHQVITGVFLRKGKERVIFSEITQVHFRSLNESEIQHYISNYEVLDKAGAYAIQEWIGLGFIEKIEGCYFNVVGLPTSQVFNELKQLGVVRF